MKKFSKSSFNIDEIISSAGELKYTREIKNILMAEYSNPSDEFVKFFTSKVHPGRITGAVLDKFTEITKRSFNGFVNDLLNERLKSAIMPEATPQVNDKAEIEVINSGDNAIETTHEELEGYYTVKSILRNILDVNRVFYRDNKSYFNILLDDNKLKTICRLHFNAKQKYIGFLGEDKKEIRTSIESLGDIYNFSEQIIETAKRFE